MTRYYCSSDLRKLQPRTPGGIGKDEMQEKKIQLKLILKHKSLLLKLYFQVEKLRLSIFSYKVRNGNRTLYVLSTSSIFLYQFIFSVKMSDPANPAENIIP